MQKIHFFLFLFFENCCISVCVSVLFTQACLCVRAVPRPGLEGLSEISCKRITDHASLAYWFTAKNTYTQNLLLACSFFICLAFFHSDIHAILLTSFIVNTLSEWVHLRLKKGKNLLYLMINYGFYYNDRKANKDLIWTCVGHGAHWITKLWETVSQTPSVNEIKTYTTQIQILMPLSLK